MAATRWASVKIMSPSNRFSSFTPTFSKINKGTLSLVNNAKIYYSLQFIGAPIPFGTNPLQKLKNSNLVIAAIKLKCFFRGLGVLVSLFRLRHSKDYLLVLTITSRFFDFYK